MGLFQKKPQVSSSIPYYTLGNTSTLLIVGLGNVGSQYDDTRHNIGFAAVDRFAADNDFPTWVDKKDLKAHFTSAQIGKNRVIVIKPTTLMNLSGNAVQATAHFYKVNPENILVVHDELDIEFGQIRTRLGGGSAGHNGIKSISGQIGEHYGRVRIGIGPKLPEQIDSADFVLAQFTSDQKSQLKNLCRETSAIISEYVYSDTGLATETRNFLV